MGGGLGVRGGEDEGGGEDGGLYAGGVMGRLGERGGGLGVRGGGVGVPGGPGEVQAIKPRFVHSAQSSGSRENRSYTKSRLSIQASSSWAVHGGRAKSDRGKM